MKIVKKVKIGGKIYNVVRTDSLVLGVKDNSAEIDFRNLEIRISQSSKSRMKNDLMHEIVHAIYDNLGYTEHDEKQIDELANAFYALVVDNPKLFC